MKHAPRRGLRCLPAESTGSSPGAPGAPARGDLDHTDTWTTCHLRLRPAGELPGNCVRTATAHRTGAAIVHPPPGPHQPPGPETRSGTSGHHLPSRPSGRGPRRRAPSTAPSVSP